MKVLYTKAFSILGGRLARNLYFWAWYIFTVFNLNINNAKAYHYDFSSPWYMVVLLSTLAILLVATYTNNLLLLPKLWVGNRKFQYVLSILGVAALAGTLHVIILKLGFPYFEVNHLQQFGTMSVDISSSLRVQQLFGDSFTYATGYLMWLFVFSMAWFMNDYSRQRKLAEQAEKRQVETELSFLKSQINPHFLFNTLNNLYGLALKHSDKTPDAILKLSAILRYLLYESGTDSVHFEKEKEIMQAYIELELLRITDSSGLHFTITSDRNNYTMPPLLWLPVLENLFKHGTRIITDDMQGDFVFSISDDQLSIHSENNFKGAVQINGSKKEGGIGLKNLRKRLELLYPAKHKIVENRSDDSYVIDVKIEL